MEVKKQFSTLPLQQFFGKYSHFLLSGFLACLIFFVLWTLSSVPTERVVAVKRDLSAGAIVTWKDVELGSWEGKVAADSLRSLEGIIGRRILVDIPRGTPLRAAYLQAADIPGDSGKQRLTMTVSQPVAQMLTAGDRVDIYQPAVCEAQADTFNNCPARLVAHAVTVVEVKGGAQDTTSSWSSGGEAASLLLEVSPSEVQDLVGVVETSSLRYILTSY